MTGRVLPKPLAKGGGASVHFACADNWHGVCIEQGGIAGPYAIALGPRCYKGLTETTTSGGFRVFEHVERLLDGPVVWAPGIERE